MVAEGWLFRAYLREDDGGSCVYFSLLRHIPYEGRRVFLGPGPAPPPALSPGSSEGRAAEDVFAGVPPEYANFIALRRILPGRRADCWTPWFPDSADDFPPEMHCFLVATENNNQHCLCLVPTGRVDGEYRRIGVCSWYLGHVDVSADGLGIRSRIIIV
jgi:hypothetical protein